MKLSTFIQISSILAIYFPFISLTLKHHRNTNIPFHSDSWKIDVKMSVLLLNSPLINRRSIYIHISLIFSLGIIDVDLNEIIYQTNL